MKCCEWWLNDGQEKIFLVFEIGGGLEDRMISKVFFIIISWEEKSKVVLSPEIFFELEDEIEGRWLEPIFRSGKFLAGGLNEDDGSSLRWLVNLEEE